MADTRTDEEIIDPRTDEEILANKDSFVLYNEPLYSIVKSLTDEQAGMLFKAIVDYAISGQEIETEDPLLQMAFNVQKTAIYKSNVKYIKTSRQNYKNAKGKGKKTEPTASDGNRPQAMEADKDKEIDKGKDKGKDKGNDTHLQTQESADADSSASCDSRNQRGEPMPEEMREKLKQMSGMFDVP